jgi:hypothetical protein
VAEEHGAARPRPPASLERGQLRARHEAEQRAQAEHEQRERQMLQQRQERECRGAPSSAERARGEGGLEARPSDTGRRGAASRTGRPCLLSRV